jgi:hypothetical protein
VTEELWVGRVVKLKDDVVRLMLETYLRGYWHGYSLVKSPFPERDIPKMHNFSRTYFRGTLEKEFGIVVTPKQISKIEQWMQEIVLMWQD